MMLPQQERVTGGPARSTSERPDGGLKGLRPTAGQCVRNQCVPRLSGRGADSLSQVVAVRPVDRWWEMVGGAARRDGARRG
jgi:hypothetical protein